MCQLSIIVPVYNTGKYLSECIDSILNQDYKDYEVIVVDDGSTDNSGKICDNYKREYSNIHVIHKNNEGACFARRDGARIAKGQYLGFIDSDDTIAIEYYNTLMGYAEQSAADVVTSGFRVGQMDIVDEYPEGLYSDNALNKIYGTMVFDCESRRSGMLCSLCTKVIKKDLYLSVVEQVEKTPALWEDLTYFYKIILKATSIYVTRYIGYHYRQNEESTSHKYDTDHIWKNMDAFQFVQQQYDGVDSAIQEQLGLLSKYVIYTELVKSIDESKTYGEMLSVIQDSRIHDYSKLILNSREYLTFFRRSEKRMLKRIYKKKYVPLFLERKTIYEFTKMKHWAGVMIRR